MKAQLVIENINFERGQDPRKAMGIGRGYRIDGPFVKGEKMKEQIHIRELADTISNWYRINNIPYGIFQFPVPDDSHERDYTPEFLIEYKGDKGMLTHEKISYIEILTKFMDLLENNDDFHRWFIQSLDHNVSWKWNHLLFPRNRRANESQSFERGQGVYKTLGLGREAQIRKFLLELVVNTQVDQVNYGEFQWKNLGVKSQLEFHGYDTQQFKSTLNKTLKKAGMDEYLIFPGLTFGRNSSHEIASYRIKVGLEDLFKVYRSGLGKWDAEKELNEGMDFERGADPVQAMDIGIVNKREFPDMLSFMNWLFLMLPKILKVRSSELREKVKWYADIGWSGSLPDDMYVDIYEWVDENGPFYIDGKKCWDLQKYHGGETFPKMNGLTWTLWLSDRLKEKGLLDNEWHEDEYEQSFNLEESISFERGKDPMDALRIGARNNPFVIEFMEQEVDGDGPITGPLSEDHDQNTWFDSCDYLETIDIFSNWEERVDGSYYFQGYFKKDGEDFSEHLHAPEINDEWVEYEDELYFIPDISDKWSKVY